MREIKLRVAYNTDERQDTGNPGWIMSKPFRLVDLEPAGDTTQFDFSDGGYLGTNDINWDSLDLIWLEFTGLKDKNGVEIYEGDIIAIDWGEYNPEKYPTKVAMEFRNYGWYPFTRALPTPDCIEVIGNIYENAGDSI